MQIFELVVLFLIVRLHWQLTCARIIICFVDLLHNAIVWFADQVLYKQMRDLRWTDGIQLQSRSIPNTVSQVITDTTVIQLQSNFIPNTVSHVIADTTVIQLQSSSIPNTVSHVIADTTVIKLQSNFIPNTVSHVIADTTVIKGHGFKVGIYCYVPLPDEIGN